MEPVTSLSYSSNRAADTEMPPSTDMPSSQELLYGTFYPQFDIPVILIWSFIILAGLGNWVLFWCFLKTKTLRNPFNMIVLALAFTNGISTTFVGPMQLSRVFVLYRPVTDAWCNTRLVLKTFCFNVSLMVIFTLAALRLYAGLSRKQLKLTRRKIGMMVLAIYILSALSSPILLDKTGSSYVNCMGQTDIERLRALLNMNPIDIREDNVTTSTLNYEEISESGKIVLAGSESSVTSFPVMSTMNGSNFPGVNTTKHSSVTKAPIRLWIYYLVLSFILFLTTVICYLTLVIVLRKYQNAIKDMSLTNKKNILTMKVTIYVTCSFFVSFLVPFFPGIVILPAQASEANLHYVAMFHCLSGIDAALSPLIYYFTNPCYRNALHKSLPFWLRKIFCCITQQVSPSSSGGTQPSVPYFISVQAHSSGPHEPRREQF